MEHPDFESSPDAYSVTLESFEGPLDLLLHLIKKHELDIYDIPIALITEQYLGYLELMQDLNLDVAGEFLVMASTLIHIKSRTLLPRPDPTQEEDWDLEDPREALVRRLLEHQKYKAAAELLHERETLRSAQFMRPDASVAEAVGDDYEPELEVDLYNLLTAFRGVLERAGRRSSMVLPPEQISIEVRMQQLLRTAVRDGCVRIRRALWRRRRFAVVHDRHVLDRTRNDPLEAHSGVPGRSVRRYPRVQACPPSRCPAPGRGSAEPLTMSETEDSIPTAGRVEPSAELRAIVEALIFASPEPITTKMLCRLLSDEPQRGRRCRRGGLEG